MKELGFWIFLSVLVICNCWIFSLGYDSLFQKHKTPAELEIQAVKIQALHDKANEGKL